MRLHAAFTASVAGCLGLAFCAGTAKGEFLGYSGDLVRIDEATAEGRIVGSISSGYGVVAMAMCPSGTVYFVGGRWYGEEAYLGTIDPATWTISSGGPNLSGSILFASQVRDVALSPEGTMFAITPEGGAGGALHTIDVETGVATLVGSTGLRGPVALAFSPEGILYGWDLGDSNATGGAGLVTIDRVTGVAVDVDPTVNAPEGLPTPVQVLGFAPDGTLYGAWKNLFIVDTATGELTLVGPLVVPPDEYFGVGSLVWIPEPATLAGLLTLAATALVAHLCGRRRRAR